jgi:hypothetical protein
MIPCNIIIEVDVPDQSRVETVAIPKLHKALHKRLKRLSRGLLRKHVAAKSRMGCLVGNLFPRVSGCQFWRKRE